MKRQNPKTKGMKPPTRPMKVLVLISLVHASWREVLNGILEFSATRSDWDLRLAAEPGDFLAPQIEEAERAGYSGIVLASPGAVDYERLALSHVPLVVAWGCSELQDRRSDCSIVTIDTHTASEMGARHLMAGGRRSCYGFVRSNIEKKWPLLRQEAFMETIRAAGRPAVAFEPPPGAREGGDHEALRDWLAALPKPAAVMADTDRRAADVIAACRDGGMNVPVDVSVVGVDDDAFYAFNSRPALSSVAPPHKEQGYKIAAELDRLMRAMARGAKPEGRHVVMRSNHIVARESTRPIGAPEVLARRIAAFVRENAAAAPTVADVARHFNCSRRLVELAFKTTRKKTAQDFIADCRVEEVKRRLSRPSATVAQVAAECGFKTAAHLSHLFKRRTGLSIREWRKRQ